MKKIILFTLGILIGFLGYAQMGTYSVSPNFGSAKASEYHQRTLDSGGVYLPNTAAHTYSVLKSYNIDPVFMLVAAAQDSANVLAHIPTDGTGDGVSARNSSTYRVNQNSYLELVEANTLPVDYSNGIPYFATYPQRTNLITYPKSLGNSYWTKSGATIEGDASTAGSELITATNDRDFSGGTIGNWLVNTDGTGTLLYSTDIGQEAKLTSAGDDTFLTGKLALSNLGTVTAGNMYKISAQIRVPAANTNKSVYIGITSVGNPTNKPYTLVADTWTDIEIYWEAGAPLTGNVFLGLNGASTAGDICYFDNVSVKEVTGYSTPLLDAGVPTVEAYKLVEDGTTGLHRIFSTAATTTIGNDYTQHVYAKAAERNWIEVIFGDGSGAYFDLTNGVVGTTDAGITTEITALVDGWYKCAITYNATLASDRVYVNIANADNSDSYTGDGTSGVYLCYPQLEEGSYASPLMLPAVEGSTTTRLSDAVTGFGDAATFSGVNSSGVIYAEIAAFQSPVISEVAVCIKKDDGVTGDNRILIRYKTNGEVGAVVRLGASTVASLDYAVTNQSVSHKVAIRFANSDYSLWVDGVNVAEQLSGAMTSTAFDKFTFEQGNETNYFFGKTKSVMVLNYLDDTSMGVLTTP